MHRLPDVGQCVAAALPVMRRRAAAATGLERAAAAASPSNTAAALQWPPDLLQPKQTKVDVAEEAEQAAELELAVLKES